MGQKRMKLNAFLKAHPNCCLCGGVQQATTIEHAPPKILFTNKLRPKGLEVPACQNCNNGMSAHDQVAAWYCLGQSRALFDDHDGTSEEFSALDKVAQGCRNNYPEVLECFSWRGDEYFNVRGILQKLPKISIDSKLYQTYLDPWAAKQALALWYSKTNHIMKTGSTILVRWISLYDLSNSPDLVNFISKFVPNVGSLQQGNWDTTQQFFHMTNFNPIEKIAGLFCAYHSSAAFLAAIIDNADVDLGKFESQNSQFSIFEIGADGVQLKC